MKYLAVGLILFVPLSAFAQWTKGINFRASSGYVTDGANETYSLHEAAEQTRNGVTFQWETTCGGDQSRDRDAGTDRRLAGINYCQNTSQGVFRVTLPAAGTYKIRLAMGDATIGLFGDRQYLAIYDDTTLKTTAIDYVFDQNDSYFLDATATMRTEANWPSQNAQATVTFASTRAVFKIGHNNGATSGTSRIAHIELEQQSSPFSGPHRLNGDLNSNLNGGLN